MGAIFTASLAGLCGGISVLAIATWLPWRIARQEAAWIAEATGKGSAEAVAVRPDSYSPLASAGIVTLAILLAVACVMSAGWSVPSACYMAFAWSLIVLGLVDLRTHLLPDAVVLPMLWLGLLLQNIKGFETIGLSSAVWGAAAGYMLLWVPAKIFSLLRRKEAMGHGDFKLMALIGAWLGPENLFQTLLASSLAAAVFHIATGCRRSAEFPFGPWLAAVAFVQVPLLLGQQCQALPCAVVPYAQDAEAPPADQAVRD